MAGVRLCFVVESGTDVRLVEGLAERFELSILARRIEGGVEISQPPVRSVPLTLGPSSRLRFAGLVWRRLRVHARAVDFVLVQGYGLAALAANLASRVTGTPSAMLVCSPVEAYYRCRKHSASPDKPFRRRDLAALLTVARMNAVVGHRYVVLSEHLADVVRRHGTRRPIDIVPVYGVDTAVFVPTSVPKASVKASLGLPVGGSLLMASSRVAPEKDTESVLAALRRLLAGGRDVWLLHRSGGYRAFGEAARRWQVAGRVVATDAVHPHDRLPLDYQASDLCVQASVEEGLGFAPLEAMACGVPVVAADVGGLRETVRDGVTGWTYPARDAAGLAKCVEAALDDPTEAARRAAAGRALVRARYEQRLVFDSLTTLIGKACGA